MEREPWWAKDVAEALGYVWHHNVVSHVPEEWKGIIPINTLGGPHKIIMVSEPRVYKRAFTSRKPEIDVVPSHLKFGATPLTPRIYLDL
jgi:prophage antirepressor-like protein